MSYSFSNKIRRTVYKLVPYSVIKVFRTNYLLWRLSRIILILFFVLPSEKTTVLGDKNSNLKFFIISRFSWEGNGLFSCVNGITSAIEYAIERGYIPIVDMKSSDNAYLYPNEVGKINAWEYYFEQPLENIDKDKFSLNEAEQSQHVVLNKYYNGGIIQAFYPSDVPSVLSGNNSIIKRWSNIYKKYVRLNESTQKYVDEQFNKIVNDGDRVLGIYVRGGEYRYSNPFGHPIQPSIDDIINQTKHFLKEWGCNKIFLTTDDEEILSIFESSFGDVLVSTDRRYTKYIVRNDGDGEYVQQIRQPDRKNEKYLSGLEYLTDIVILSKCNCIIGSTTCGVIAAVLMSDGFEHSYFFNCGVFGVTDNSKCSKFSTEKNTWVLK